MRHLVYSNLVLSLKKLKWQGNDKQFAKLCLGPRDAWFKNEAFSSQPRPPPSPRSYLFIKILLIRTVF